MNRIAKILGVGGVLAVAGTLGWAALADMPAHGMGMGMGMHRGMGGGAMHGGPRHGIAEPAHIEALKTELGITPAQKAAWDKYARTVQAAAEGAKKAHESVDHDAVGKMTPPDRFAFANKMREQAQKRFETVYNAANTLLAGLDEAQKTKARNILPGLAMPGHGMMHGRAMGGPQHGGPHH